MKRKFLRQILVMSKYALFGMSLQCLLFSVVLAEVSNAQTKSIDEVYLSVEFNETPLEQAAEILKQKTSFDFYFDKTVVDRNTTINATFDSSNLREVLTEISISTGLRFKRINDSIFISYDDSNESEQVEEDIIEEVLLPIQINGRITDSAGEPLPGVNIVIKGTSTGTTSDFDGNYRLEVEQGATLVFSYIGYQSQDIAVTSQSTLNVTLEVDYSQLEEVVVVGYGTVRKSDLTGSVANVKGDALENLPSPRVDQLLTGRMAGVNVTSRSGEPGAGATIRIRGGNSINGNNEPLYVIDGYIAGQGFDLNTVNVNDIQSIEVLKDASSLAIYGTRGSNGVILITTKTGKGITSGKPEVSLNYYHGWQSVLNEIDYIDGNQYRAYRQEGGDSFFDDLLGNTGWFGEVTQTAQTDILN